MSSPTGPQGESWGPVLSLRAAMRSTVAMRRIYRTGTGGRSLEAM